MQDASFHLAADDGAEDFRAEGALSTSAPSAFTPGPWALFERQAKGSTATVWLVTHGTECYRREGGATFRRRASTFRSAEAAQRVADRLNKEADPRNEYIKAQIRRVQSHPAAIVPEDLVAARKLLAETRHPCVAYVQRKLGIGYNYAQQLYLAATGERA